MTEHKNQKYYEVILFETPKDLTGEGRDDIFIPVSSRRTRDILEALEWYANIPCPASQFIEADSEKELNVKRRQIIDLIADHDYCIKNVFPCL